MARCFTRRGVESVEEAAFCASYDTLQVERRIGRFLEGDEAMSGNRYFSLSRQIRY